MGICLESKFISITVQPSWVIRKKIRAGSSVRKKNRDGCLSQSLCLFLIRVVNSGTFIVINTIIRWKICTMRAILGQWWECVRNWRWWLILCCSPDDCQRRSGLFHRFEYLPCVPQRGGPRVGLMTLLMKTLAVTSVGNEPWTSQCKWWLVVVFCGWVVGWWVHMRCWTWMGTNKIKDGQAQTSDETLSWTQDEDSHLACHWIKKWYNWAVLSVRNEQIKKVIIYVDHYVDLCIYMCDYITH